MHGIRIGSKVWIGVPPPILPGVEIGDGTAIGAGSVVTRSIRPAALPSEIRAGLSGGYEEKKYICNK